MTEPEVVFRCDHDIAWAPFVLTSDPPQHPWICRICFEEGVERLGPKSSPELEDYATAKTRKSNSEAEFQKPE